ncbi:MAG: dipeptide epimerase [Lachnospiraceae bacterium]|nr:dipeptide epimerase [Lachnospiraceae bacterium]
MKIEKIELGYVHIPLITPFRTALRTVDGIHDLIVRITADDGSFGFGEAPPTAVITGDTKESIEAAIRGYIAPSIIGMDLLDLDEVMRKMEKSIAKNTSAKAAVNIALYDLYAKQMGMPLYRVLSGEAGGAAAKAESGKPGGAAAKAESGKPGCGEAAKAESGKPGGAAAKAKFGGISEIETDITISVDETEKMVRDSLRAVADGFRILKVKVGKGGKKDVERVREIRRAVGPEAILRIDANQGWSAEEAISTIRAMEEEGLKIELVEQPVSCHDFRGLQRVTKAVDTPILADESVFSYEDAERIIEEHAADYINIKLMKTGGIHQAMRICDLADRYQVNCMIGCMLESKVSVSAGAHLAGARSCITMADLDGPSLCAGDPYEGGPVYSGPKIYLNEDAGIGIRKVPADVFAR